MNFQANNRLELDEFPQNIQELLMLAVQHWENFSEANKYINEALTLAGDRQDRVIMTYRHLFYKELRKLTFRRE
jgi:hypothetical protein